MEQQEAVRQLKLTPASEIPSTRQRWLWNNKIPLGTLTLFAGRGGEGKSSFALWVAAHVNAGTLDGDMNGAPGSVLIVSHEDDWGTVMKPRLEGAGADTDRVFKLEVEMVTDENTHETVPVFPMDLGLIREAVMQSGAKLIILDPIASSMGGDLHKVADVRKALDPLASLAQQLGIAVIGVMHFSKGQGNASDKLSGSHAFRDAVRSVMLFATDEETGQRVVTIDKNNYSQSRGESFAFTLESAQVITDDNELTTVGRVEYLGETDVSVSDIINRGAGDDGEGDDRNAAQAFILDYLKGKLEDGCEAPAGEVIKAGRAAGFSDNEIKHARRRSKSPKVASRKASFGGGWVWAIDDLEPQGATQGAEESTLTDSDTFGTFVAPSTEKLAPVTPIGGNT
ncbi:AAA family ATPase [Leucobacter chinensis]|uniref:AAA family ATPase n=1 Tax=Leucobacter chinensis TaxID=2851010 RepID=UPI001C21EF7C|nr:AAA family ATPase [Leucobacter chinensis]